MLVTSAGWPNAPVRLLHDAEKADLHKMCTNSALRVIMTRANVAQRSMLRHRMIARRHHRAARAKRISQSRVTSMAWRKEWRHVIVGYRLAVQSLVRVGFPIIFRERAQACARVCLRRRACISIYVRMRAGVRACTHACTWACVRACVRP